MTRQTLMQRLALACAMLATGVVAQAQPPSQTTRPSPALSQGPLMYGPLPNYGFGRSYGSSLRDTGDMDAVPPVFYTSINYPGVYGSHTIGIAARSTRTWHRSR